MSPSRKRRPKPAPSLAPEQFLASCPPAVGALAAELRALVQAAVPGPEERVNPGWRALAYRDAQAGYFCGIFPRDGDVRFLLEHGAALPDPEGLFTGGGRQTRHVDLRPGEPVPGAGLRRLLERALLHGSVRGTKIPRLPVRPA